MDERGNEVHASTTEASAGSREGVVRWVLLVGLVLIIAAFAIIVATGMLSQDDGADSQWNKSREMAAQEHANADRDRNGEPMAPAFGEDPGASTTQQSNAAPDAAPPSSAATPGDAPAGDPTNTAQ